MIKKITNKFPKLSLLQMLGLCPLLAVSINTTNAFSLGITTTLILIITNFFISLSRFFIFKEVRILLYVIVISSIESCIEMIMKSYTYNLYQAIGIFIPLIVTNCIVIGQAESIALKKNIFISLLSALSNGLSITITMTIIGTIREIIGNGTIFSGADYFLGSWAKILYLKIINFNYPMLIIILPPGAFFIFGFLLAINNFFKYKINNVIK